MAFLRGPCHCGSAACGAKCDCNCHCYDAYDCSSILAGIKYFYPKVCVGVLAGASRNDVFRWMQTNAKALHEFLPKYLEDSGLAEEEIDEDDYHTVPLDIAECMGENEPDGRNFPEKRKSPSPSPPSSSPTLRFWEPPTEGSSLCKAFGISPTSVIRRCGLPKITARNTSAYSAFKINKNDNNKKRKRVSIDK